MTATGPVRLTAFSHGAGCACKLPAADLRSLLALTAGLGDVDDPRLLVGLETGDDAAVYAVTETEAVVLTTDFFTPIVDDPADWGRIAAANSLSDVYAMGGRPLLALNLVAWPRDGLDLSLLAAVLGGAAEVAHRAGCIVAGGHSIDDPEPKYGMAVAGTVDPSRVLRNSGARPGDALVLTKPLGVGLVTTALKRGAAPDRMLAEAVEVMTTLNDGARDAALALGAAVHAVTDVTGFGLVGHLREMLTAAGVAAQIDADTVPRLDGVLELAAAGLVAGGTERNHADAAGRVEWGPLAREAQLLLADAQTSGGLLIAVESAGADRLTAELRARSTPAAAVVGRVVEGPAGTVSVV